MLDVIFGIATVSLGLAALLYFLQREFDSKNSRLKERMPGCRR